MLLDENCSRDTPKSDGSPLAVRPTAAPFKADRRISEGGSNRLARLDWPQVVRVHVMGRGHAGTHCFTTQPTHRITRGFTKMCASPMTFSVLVFSESSFPDA